MERDAFEAPSEPEDPTAGRGSSAIVLDKMPQQLEVRVPDDDWTGRASAAERRKLQNRLHQRSYRKRQKQLRNGGHFLQQAKFNAHPSPESVNCLLKSRREEDISSRRDFWMSTSQLWPSIPFAGMTNAQIRSVMQSHEVLVSQEVMLGSPRSDLLLTLIQFNVFRALVHNTFALNFNFSWLTDDAISPFIETDAAEHAYHSPSNLRPSHLQRTVEHHPWIDLFPFPPLRDNILRRGETFDDELLCYDLVETCHTPSERSGLIVWGEPWDPNSWEVTEEFARKWSWVLQGCRELLASTKYWRDMRGDDDLFFDI